MSGNLERTGSSDSGKHQCRNPPGSRDAAGMGTAEKTGKDSVVDKYFFLYY